MIVRGKAVTLVTVVRSGTTWKSVQRVVGASGYTVVACLVKVLSESNSS